MLKLMVIGLGGFLGAVARYSLSGLVHRLSRTSFPAGTLTVNVVGCLLIGGLMCLLEQRQMFSPTTRLFLLVGLLGSFTTFSTVGYETFEFFRASDFQMATLNVAVNVLLGLAAVMLGWVAVRAIGV